MENIITFYPTAQWAVVNGAFTANELRDIAEKIDKPELREDPIKTGKDTGGL